ncbi:DUF4199 domain-containing protein [Pontibacter harenae]|uniref:DUF4199 domain-containing protein n=1 Tax=Pontibacter harenae TaxID=2894083 RepID=UPI001E3EBDBC|nr:DUF4199 domain-containing protein [Pontibacter harenae]MCC9167125.1 DUF4199 domain-containing protein [Pontibacter harenae]
MFNQAIVRVGVRYGVICGIACFAFLLMFYFVGANPLGELGQFSYLPIPIALFLGIRYYKTFFDAELGFLRGLRVGLSVSFYTALTASLLVAILLYLVGPALIQQHAQEMKALFEQTREEQVKLFGEQTFEQGYKALDNLTPSMLAADDFMKRMLIGGVLSLVLAVFFRK